MTTSLPVLKVSASSLKTYTQCPRKYYFTYIDKQPKKDWGHLELGNFVHGVLEDFHNQLKDDNIGEDDWGELLTTICKNRVSEFKLEPEQKRASKEMLKLYLDLLRRDGLPNVLFNEKDFNIKLKDDLIIRGFIDRIDSDPDLGFHIVDYKTGKSKYLDDFQLLIYGIYLLNENPDVAKFKASYLALAEGSKMLSYTFTKTDVQRVVSKIIAIADQIREDKTWEPKPQFLCSYCDFEEICPSTLKERQFKQNKGWN